MTGDLLQTFSNPNATANDGFGNSLGIEGDTLFIAARDDSFNGDTSGVLYVYEVGIGQDQNNPILPSNFDPNTLTYTFNDVISSQWFDPPFVDSFTYAITNPQSLFTKILDFPTGFDNSFNVSVGGNDLGIFAPGDMVDFVSLLGAGVKEFTVSGIDPLVDVENPLGFPIQLEFDTLRASFTMTQVMIKQETTDLTSTLKEVYFSEILQEIQAIPREHWSNLLQILRAFREVTNPTVGISVNQTNNLLENYDISEQEKRNQAALELLRRWRDDDDDLENQKETWEILSKAFDIND